MGKMHIAGGNMSEVKSFIRAWSDYQNNRGKTRTLAGVYLIALLAEKEQPGVAKEFLEVWENRNNGKL